MKSLAILIAGLGVSLALCAAPVSARPAHAPTGRSCCRAPAGTAVGIELVDEVSTKVQKTGDTFALRLAQPLVVNGRILLPAGTPGVGEVIDSSKPGMGGKSAKLVLAARYLTWRQRRIPLQSLQLSAAGRSNTTAARAVGLTGMIFMPLGFAGLAVKGGPVVFPAGMAATAKLASNVVLPSLGPAPPAAAPVAAEDAVAGSIDIPPPPAGKGQVIFFRKKSLLSLGQWFKVRESGQALGKLTNGAYFIQVADPGTHDYTATFEPELKDHLKLQVDAGETYFVEGTVTKALVVGAADLSPSDRARFDKASKDLKPAPPLTDEKDDDQPANTTGDGGAGQAPK